MKSYILLLPLLLVFTSCASTPDPMDHAKAHPPTAHGTGGPAYAGDAGGVQSQDVAAPVPSETASQSQCASSRSCVEMHPGSQANVSAETSPMAPTEHQGAGAGSNAGFKQQAGQAGMPPASSSQGAANRAPSPSPIASPTPAPSPLRDPNTVLPADQMNRRARSAAPPTKGK